MKLKPIPAEGLTAEQLREAAVQLDYRQIADMVRAAHEAKMKAAAMPGEQVPWCCLEAIYADRAVFEVKGKYYAYAYTISDDNQVTLGEPEEVVETYVPVKTAMKEAVFIEAADGEGAEPGSRWQIRVIRAGMSHNRVFYPDAVLREAAPLFNGARVFNKSDTEHIKGEGKSVDKLIGRLAESVFVAGAAPDTGEIRAIFEVIEPQGDVAVKIREAYARQMASLFGFSIDADGTAKTQMREGKRTKVAASITKVNSVDLIVEPSAGGELIRMVESVNSEEEQRDMKLRERMLNTIKAKNPAFDADSATDEQIETAYREAVAPEPVAGVIAPAGVTPEQVQEQIRMVEARGNMRVAIAACNLPQAAKDKLLAAFSTRERFTEADVTGAIDAERQYLAKFTESGHVVVPFGEGGRITVSRAENVAGMLDAFFDPAHKDHREHQSFKECYIQVTGDRRVTGRLQDCDMASLREAAGVSFRESLDSTSWASVLGSSLNRRMVADFRSAVEYDMWRKVVNVVPVTDFRNQERVRYGGYGDLPDVAQGQPYSALASPTDEKASYAVSKRGGTEDITLEMIKNDDVGAIARIPTKLGRAAKRTLAKFVFDVFRTNPVIYDGKNLFHADHGNLGAAALDATSLAARRLAMLKQAEMDSADRLGIGPKYLLVSVDGQEGAVNLFNRSTNNDKTFIQTMTLEILPIWYWTDANDWALSADPKDIPTIEVGFLDGAEEPELFVQDNPTVGSMFTHDKLTYKIRHIYGRVVEEYRGMDKSVVA